MSDFVYTEEVTGEIVQIPIRLLHHHHDNPRKDLGDLTELTESIKAKGVLQNLTVVPFWFKTTGVGCDDPKAQADMGYLVVIGNRRLEAAKKAGFETLPCVIAKMTPAEQVQTMLLENMQRSDLTVYEQAQGFQMMFDLGAGVDEIAEKTGFSKTTVKRRLEWAKLDAETLKEVSGRQITLGDLDKLSAIENIDTRNKVLCEIGTANYENRLSQAINAEKNKRNAERWKKALEQIDAVECTMSELRTRYAWIEDGFFSLADDVQKCIDKLPKEKLFYAFEAGFIYFRIERKQETTQEDVERGRIEAERAMRKNRLQEAFKNAYQLRVNYVKNLSEARAKSYVSDTAAALIRAESSSHAYIRRDKKTISDMLGAPIEDLERAGFLLPYKTMIAYTIYRLGDNSDIDCYDWYGNYQQNQVLDSIYTTLDEFGYEISDEEEALLRGTSALYAKSED